MNRILRTRVLTNPLFDDFEFFCGIDSGLKRIAHTISASNYAQRLQKLEVHFLFAARTCDFIDLQIQLREAVVRFSP
jgi:hypothetical protein